MENLSVWQMAQTFVDGHCIQDDPQKVATAMLTRKELAYGWLAAASACKTGLCTHTHNLNKANTST